VGFFISIYQGSVLNIFLIFNWQLLQMSTEALSILKMHYGYDQFRPMQADIIECVVAKKDVVVLMPTGGGKSICFQVPALLMEGLCVVVSPLISLMKDQVDALNSNNIPAAYLNSSLHYSEEEDIVLRCINGKIKLLYISPERLVQEAERLLKRLPISLFAIDEAHCISSWGHDFRPEYTQLKLLKEKYTGIPVIALTATADKATRKDIVKQLNLNEPRIFISSFDRPNLSLTVKPGIKPKERIKEIAEFIHERKDEAGIVYCLSRQTTEKVADALKSYGINAGCYHAGLSAVERNRVQEDFINDKVQVVCATVAFGMGIDKSNVRWVIHFNLPKNIEGYYQEIGRAGRDGVNSDTVLYYNVADLVMLTKFAQEGNQAEINLQKLKRMQQFAEADICRRKILLSYFGETAVDNCQNCDVCENPRQHFDGTLLVQKALSALMRMNESVGVTMLIDVLRGSTKGEIVHLGYNKIKTYGAGADISYANWEQYIMQMLNLGFIEIAYDEASVLKVTELGKEIVFGKRPAELVQIQQKVNIPVKEKKRREYTSTADAPADLFEALRKLRKKIAEAEKLPAYIIFNDATLREMASEKPLTEEEMLAVSGVGQHKFEKYGQQFMSVIHEVCYGITSAKPSKLNTLDETLNLYRLGFSLEEIAVKRALSSTTINSHIAQLYVKGDIDSISNLIKEVEIHRVLEAVRTIGKTDRLRDIFELLNGELDYSKIRLAIAHIDKHRLI
jgi:ATP-dependent DNA helicase RecQ